MTADSGERTGRATVLRRLAFFVVLLTLVLVAIHFLPIREWLTTLQRYARGAGFIGYIVYALVYAFCCVLFIPGSLLTLGAGAIFGVAAGTAVVVAGATLGAGAAFLLGRTVMRKRIAALTAGNERFAALDRAIAAEGAKIVFLVRLSPLFPFTWVNYAFGLTGVPFLRYLAATFAGIIPATLAFVYLGYAAAGATTSNAGTLKITLQIIGAIATLVVTLYVAQLARKAIRRAGVDR